MDSEAQPRPKRSRGSCATCRRRHVKCDKNRPVCNTCSRAGVGCDGFAADVRWAAPSGQAASCSTGNAASAAPGAAQRSRRHLYTGNAPACPCFLAFSGPHTPLLLPG